MVRRFNTELKSLGFLSTPSRAASAALTCTMLLVGRSAHAEPPGEAPKVQPRSAPSAEVPSDPTTAPNRDALMPDEPTRPSATGAPAIDPLRDKQKLVEQGSQRPTSDGTIGARASEVYSEDWWAHTRPIFELHGYFRTRGEFFHNFALGRHDVTGQGLWDHPQDNSFTDKSGVRRQVLLCGDPSTTGPLGECTSNSQAHANLRLRLNPELHISDNLRIMAQVDMLDNLVLGSTPDTFAARPSGTSPTGYSTAVNGNNAYAPLGALATTQGPPTAGINGVRNSIDVQRAWAEYLTPVGQLRFGRMPTHWGLGMVNNSGDCLDCDFQTNSDRIMFVSGLRSLDLYFGGSWEFVSTGPTNRTAYDVYGGQPYNTANSTNVGQWVFFAARRMNPDLQRLKIARGDVVVNGGFYGTYRQQLLDVASGQTPLTLDRVGATANNGLERRGAEALIPDVWVQLLYNKLRIEAEAAAVLGSIESSPVSANAADPLKLRMWGLATQAEFRAVEDKLRIQFGHGWASGDPNVEGLTPGTGGMQPRLSRGAISTFRFHPAYYVDYIFFRRIMTRVQNAYYFRPSVEYDFIRHANGQKLGGGAAIIWSRASEFVQAPGNKRDLGVELDLQVYYQAKDGSLNDDPTKMGGFYSALQYGVFFPLGGLEYLKSEQDTTKLADWSLSTAQTVRLILGVMF
jgi:uncharacterized protein (TIGR04551 family)